MHTPPLHTQIAVIGAGPVGVLAALALQRQGKQVLLIEARPQHTVIRDKRTLALSFNSVAAFAAAGIELPQDESTPIIDVHISQQGLFGRTLLRAADMGVAALGRTVDYAVLMRQCEAALIEQETPVLWDTQVRRVRTLKHFAELSLEHNGESHQLTADWVILAEGGHLTDGLPGLQRHSYDYRQSALVTTLTFEQAGNGTAYERFADEGPFALLPYHDAWRLVWTRSPEDAIALKDMPFEAFASRFEAAFGSRLGALQSRGEAAVFPLQLKQLNKVYSGRVICIGNAAQTMHPVAAQGLNLGVRDALAVSRLLGEARNLNQPDLAVHYAASRRLDAHAIVGFTHSLVTLFDHPDLVLKLGRSGVMSLLDSLPSARKKFTEQLIFGL
ncbi:MAG: FAD-dependent monooxygenase [Neisseria sp.]|uniref:FAD-dependent monooxygenase n=1 Tax=Neisseria sp. TaxID=192066 RepID=UPI0026DC703F|nr:FAD-dependent monooxygenase [Neisseria sp.]MDO4248349.1 FAD-dependent monooxygenase [Neisseria sp.]